MQGDTRLIIEATRKASKALQRDFFELENLQTSERDTSNFCQKSCMRAMQTLKDSLGKYFDNVIFDNESAESANFTGKAIFVEVLDGFSNFTRSLPYFAIMVSVVIKEDSSLIAQRSVINFPALGEIYYAEQGKGAWLERLDSSMSGATRLRVSGCGDIRKMLIASSGSLIDSAQKISSNIRVFDSYTYCLSQMVRGKIDAFITKPRSISITGICLFLSETGGAYEVINANLISSNFKLYEKIKPLLK